jgi:hypothetical protein
MNQPNTSERPDWYSREQQRFYDGTYTAVPVSLDYPMEHFVHLSVTPSEPDQVAYTPSDTYGAADRQVRLKYGRYLKKAFPDLSDADIQSHVTAFKSALAIVASAPVLRFATDIDTINRIFETEMNACGSSCSSCMHGKFDGNDIRPYHVYANSPDVAVAYVTAGDAIVSRSVVSTKHMSWVRAYSVSTGDNDTDCGTLRQLLKDAGYSKGTLTGSRLTKLNTRKVMLPYIDNGGAYVQDCGHYWLVVDDDEGEYQADCTDGTATECDSHRCDRCDNHEDDCSCIYCDCCDESFADGCDNCRMCEHCERCTEHDRCHCDRCSECHELIEHYRHCSHCECERCNDCNELMDDCECEPEEDEDSESEDLESALEPDLPVVALTPVGARMKIERIWAYIVNLPIPAHERELPRVILQTAFKAIDITTDTEVAA